MPKTKFCSGLSDISDSYMGCIIDGWGVLHDGEDAFEHTVDTLKELNKRKKHIIILVNEAVTAPVYKEKLRKMGIGPSLYNEIVTPYEMIYQGIKNQEDLGSEEGAIWDNIGKRCYVFGRPGQEDFLKDLDIEFVEDIENAQFVLMLGMDYPRKTLESYEPVIRRAIQLRLKAICAAPDSQGLIGTNLLTGPSLVARRYQDAGGIVLNIGKPYTHIFKYCIELLRNQEIYPAHTVVLGDTMALDMIGAHAVNLDACLFKSGLHAANFMHCQNPKEVDNTLKNLIKQYNNTMPLYLVDEMRWGNALPDRKHKRRKQPR